MKVFTAYWYTEEPEVLVEVPGGVTEGDGVVVEGAAGFEAVLASVPFQEV